jgi:hypothetical protein
MKIIEQFKILITRLCINERAINWIPNERGTEFRSCYGTDTFIVVFTSPEYIKKQFAFHSELDNTARYRKSKTQLSIKELPKLYRCVCHAY